MARQVSKVQTNTSVLTKKKKKKRSPCRINAKNQNNRRQRKQMWQPSQGERSQALPGSPETSTFPSETKSCRTQQLHVRRPRPGTPGLVALGLDKGALSSDGRKPRPAASSQAHLEKESGRHTGRQGKGGGGARKPAPTVPLRKHRGAPTRPEEKGRLGQSEADSGSAVASGPRTRPDAFRVLR